MQRSSWFGKLLILFTVVPLTELYLLYKLAEVTSWPTTFLVVLGTGFLGAYLAKSEGRYILYKIQQETSQGRMPGEELVNGLCVLIGGALLLTPGIVTDFFGFTLIIPLTRNLYKKFIINKLREMVERGNVNVVWHQQ